MNKILSLFDEQYAREYFRRKLLPHYPGFSEITGVRLRPYKKLIWETTYHVVIGYTISLLAPAGKTEEIEVVCVAHSDEPRANVYEALRYLWQNGLPDDEIVLPRPLFFSQGFNGTFYRAIRGENLLHYIKANDREAVNHLVVLAAKLFAKLHSLPTAAAPNFNPANSRIATVIPGVPNILAEMASRYDGRYSEDLQRIYRSFIAAEEGYFSGVPALSLIHGDAHPENILRAGDQKVGLIDFTDLCLGDPARDLGTFIQQLEYKIKGKLNDAAYARETRDLFLSAYQEARQISLDGSWPERIRLYYNWTAIRTAIYHFLKFDSDEASGRRLLEGVKDNWGI
jgi:aminoglycoside phosphotransferase